MRMRTIAVGLVICMILPRAGLAGEASSAPYDVTFEVPLNLTRLSPLITQIDVTCTITSKAVIASASGIAATTSARSTTTTGLSQSVKLSVAQGRVVDRANVVVPIPASRLQDPTGKTANYACKLTAYAPSSKAGWGVLEEKSADPAFRLAPTPKPITGSFVW